MGASGYPIGQNVGVRLQAMQDALILIARARKDCPSGLQRISRDELSSIARECLGELGVDWRIAAGELSKELAP